LNEFQGISRRQELGSPVDHVFFQKEMPVFLKATQICLYPVLEILKLPKKLFITEKQKETRTIKV